MSSELRWTVEYSSSSNQDKIALTHQEDGHYMVLVYSCMGLQNLHASYLEGAPRRFAVLHAAMPDPFGLLLSLGSLHAIQHLGVHVGPVVGGSSYIGCRSHCFVLEPLKRP